MDKKNIFAVIIIVLSLFMAVVSYIILPSSVITQFSLVSDNVTVMPKLFAVAIPFLLGAIGGLLSFFSKEDKTKIKCLFISVVGITIFIIMIAVNRPVL